jgi:hypothetical protein
MGITGALHRVKYNCAACAIVSYRHIVHPSISEWCILARVSHDHGGSTMKGRLV